MKIFKISAAMLISTIVSTGFANAADGFAPGVADNGDITMPDVDYRKDWSHIGTWSVAGDDGVGFHSVYTQPEMVDAYRSTGKFPDGAVLIKELWGGKTEDLTTGAASSQAKLAGWFVMVKDSTERFKDHGLWGDGWGWAHFGPDSPKKTDSTDYESDCIGCHEPVRDTDLIYSYAYPALQGKGVE